MKMKRCARVGALLACAFAVVVGAEPARGITTDGPRSGPGTSPRDLAARWAAALSAGNQRALLDLITKDWWSGCIDSDAGAFERERHDDVARSLGTLAVGLPRGLKLTKAEALSREKRIKKGDELEGCVADHDLVVQRWRFTLRKGKDAPTTQDYDLIAVDGKWALRGP